MTAAEAERHVLNLAVGHTLTSDDVEAVRVFHGYAYEVLGRAADLEHRLNAREAADGRLSGGVAAGHRHYNGHAPAGG